MNDRIARFVAAGAAALIAAAGLAEIIAGSNRWTGDKNDPTILGVGTLVAAAIVGLAASLTPRASTTPQRLGVAAGLAFPSLLVLSTAGIVAIPGAIVGTAAAVMVIQGARQHGSITKALSAAWLEILLGVLAFIYLAFGVVAGWVGVLGIVGALAVVASIVMHHLGTRRAAAVVLLAGAVPFAAAAWWSVVVPLTALLMITIGVAHLLNRHTPPVAVRGER